MKGLRPKLLRERNRPRFPAPFTPRSLRSSGHSAGMPLAGTGVPSLKTRSAKHDYVLRRRPLRLCVARLVRRLQNSRYALKQSSPRSPDRSPLLGGAQGKGIQNGQLLAGECPPLIELKCPLSGQFCMTGFRPTPEGRRARPPRRPRAARPLPR